MWEERCWGFYQPESHHKIPRACRLINDARFRINFVFTRALATNRVIFHQMVTNINRAQSTARISALLQLMERNLVLNSEIRARYAVAIIQHLRHDLYPLFGRSHGFYRDKWYRTVYRMTFGLTSDGLYHPAPIPTPIYPGMLYLLFTYSEDYFLQV
jgi:hypothetical protein